MSLIGYQASCGRLHKGRSAVSGRRVCTVTVCSSHASPSHATNGVMSRRAALVSGLAILTVVAADRPARAVSAYEGVEEYSRLEDAGKLNTAKALDNIRAKYNFKRSPDGRVLVRSSKGTYFAVRLDMGVPGCLLFRNTSNGEIFALQTEGLQQVDLTNDHVVILMLGDGGWEDAMSAVTAEDESGNTKTITLTESEFRNLVTLISMTEGGQEGEEDGQADK